MALDFDALDHNYFMREALKEATLASQHNHRPIGAVIVHSGQIVGRGHAQHQASQSKIAHAEMRALTQAAPYIYALKEASHDCVIYSTLEPCVMCLGAIVMSDIDHLVYAMPDRWINPQQMFAVDYVKRHLQHYVGGILAAESTALWEQVNPEELRMIREGIR